MNRSQIMGGIMGVVVGDALGLPVQFEGRLRRKLRPVTGMEGWGAFNMPPGSWSDEGGFGMTDIKEDLGNIWEKTKKKAEELVDKTGDKLEELKDKAEDKIEELKDKAHTDKMDKIEDKVDKLEAKVDKSKIENLEDKLDELKDKID